MQRKILIIDDHDDLASALEEVFVTTGHAVEVLENYKQAMAVPDMEGYDLVITDLDVHHADVGQFNGNGNGQNDNAECMPEIELEEGEPLPKEDIKAFKLCASNFRRDAFNEDELTNFIATILDYKGRFVDRVDYVQNLHENIEFELPSAIRPMHVVLEYLMKRVEKLGVIKPEQSNLFVALDEAFVNAVKHGNKFDTQKLVRVTAEVSRHEARFTIEDEGEGFDVNSIPDPLDPENLFKTSGRGVMFIYNIMDEVKYNERGNRLTMVKRSEKNGDETKL